MGVFLIFYIFLTLPVLILRPRKFATTYTFASLCLLAGFSVLQGPASHMKSLFSRERRVFSAIYFGSLFMTLYSAMSLQSTILSLLMAFIQMASFAYDAVRNVPGGIAG